MWRVLYCVSRAVCVAGYTVMLEEAAAISHASQLGESVGLQ